MALSKKLLKFKEKAFAHEVVVGTNEIDSAIVLVSTYWDIEYNADGCYILKKIPENTTSILLVHYDFDGKSYEVAFVDDLNYIFLGENIGYGDENQETYFEFQGTMKVDDFWEYLGTMPNKFKYLKKDPTGRSEYWKNFKSVNITNEN